MTYFSGPAALSRRRPASGTRAWRSPAAVPELRCPGLEVAPLGKAGRPACRAPVVRARGCAVARHLQQVRADGIEAMVAGDAVIVVEPAQKLESRPRAVHHRDR